MMARTTKVLDIRENGCHLEVIRINDRKAPNPYVIRKIWQGGDHRAKIAEYGDWMSVLYFLLDFYRNGMDVRTLAEIKDWWRKGFGDE